MKTVSFSISVISFACLELLECKKGSYVFQNSLWLSACASLERNSLMALRLNEVHVLALSEKESTGHLESATSRRAKWLAMRRKIFSYIICCDTRRHTMTSIRLKQQLTALFKNTRILEFKSQLTLYVFLFIKVHCL